MPRRAIHILAIALSFATLARGDIKATIDINRDDAATAEFKFKSVPSPAKTDAANLAKFSIAGGRRDRNGADMTCLNDGKLPANPDDPASSFFFAARSEGGRVVLDFEKPIEMKAIHTYSWHAGTRGPQVYKLYAGDPAAKDFDSRPARDRDPAAAGWKLVASVDTREKDKQPGGQYAVAITDAAGAIGTYRYLLFDVARTESDDAFGNTFYSEIDVLDGKEHPLPTERDAGPPKPAELDVIKIGERYEIAFDTSQMPQIKDWVDKKLKPVCTAWYPKIVELLPSEGYTAPRRFTIIFHKDMRGVANAGGGRINCAGEWFMRNLDGEAAGAVVHEMVHIVQQYGRSRGGGRNPGWMVEGVADYIRWFLYEPADKRPRPNPARARYTDSYRTTAAFLNYLVEKHDMELVKKFNAAMRRGEYSDERWKEYTGKTLDDLWADYVETLKKG
jgi:hypothetical protein